MRFIKRGDVLCILPLGILCWCCTKIMSSEVLVIQIKVTTDKWLWLGQLHDSLLPFLSVNFHLLLLLDATIVVYSKNNKSWSTLLSLLCRPYLIFCNLLLAEARSQGRPGSLLHWTAWWRDSHRGTNLYPFLETLLCKPVWHNAYKIFTSVHIYSSFWIFVHYLFQSDFSGEIVKILREDGGKDAEL